MGKVWLSGEVAAAAKHTFGGYTYEYKNKEGGDLRIADVNYW